MSDIVIAFNPSNNSFEASLDGVVLASSPNQSYLKQKVRNMGYAVGDKPAAAPMVSALTAAVVAKPSEFTVEERFNFIERFTKGVANASYLSLVLVGGPGLGKTHVVLQTLKDLGLKEILPMNIAPAQKGGEVDEEVREMLLEGEPLVDEGDFIVIKGFSTPKALYRALYDNNGKIIVIDDADGAFADKNAANILKGALDSSVPRYISWMTEKKSNDDDLPSRFEFTGRIIFISNLEMSQFPAAILSRSVHVDLDLTMEEKIERIELILGKYEDADGHAAQVLALVKEHAPKFKELSVRTAMMLMQIRKAENDDKMFKRMALYHAMA